MGDQGTSLLPTRLSFDRLTGLAVWYPGGYAPFIGGYHLGVIDTHAIDEGIAREKVTIAAGGSVDLLFEEIVSVAPILSLKGKQFMTTIVPLLLMGTAGALDQQSSRAALVVTISAELGKSFDLDSRNLSSAVVDVDGVVKMPEVDYFIDLALGLIRFPNVAAGIAEADAVNVTMSIPGLGRDTIIAFNRLNQAGDLRFFQTSGFSPAPVIEMLLPGSISRDKGNDGDPVKSNQWALRFALEGTPQILRIGLWDELLLDDGGALIYA
jgi:hypothetical protein